MKWSILIDCDVSNMERFNERFLKTGDWGIKELVITTDLIKGIIICDEPNEANP